MKAFVRILCALLSVVLLVCMFAACGKDDQDKKSETPAQTGEQQETKTASETPASEDPTRYIPSQKGTEGLEIGDSGEVPEIEW